MINRTIIKIYQDGYDEVNIKFDNPETIENIQFVMNQLIGYEIIDHGKHFCSIKDISGPGELNFYVLLRRVFLIAKSIFEDGIKALEDEDHAVIKSLIHRDLEINKMINFCIRILNKKGLEKQGDISIYMTIVHNCELLCDEYKHMLQFKLNKKIKIDGEFTEIHRRMNFFFGLIYNFTFDRKREKALDIAKEYEILKREIQDLLINKPDNPLLFFFRNIINNIVFIQELQLSRIKDI